MKKAYWTCLVAAALQACGPGDTRIVEEQPTEPGRLVIVGGALQADNAAVYSAVLDARDGDGPLCVIPTASADPVEAIDGAVATLTEYGGPESAKGVLLSTDEPQRAQDPAVTSELTACSGFYFTGGSQSRILDVFLPQGDTTQAYRTLWQRWREGAVVAGTSAGAAMMSRVMISGGSSDEAVARGVADGPDADGVVIRPGMGFFEPILDQHFLARGRIGRLIVAVTYPDAPPVGFGIDENTALVVDGDSALVVGASGVVLVDGRSAGSSGTSEVTVNLVGAGDVIDLSSFAIRREEAKNDLPHVAPDFDPPEDPFARWAFLHLLRDLASSSATEASFALPGRTLRIAKAAGFSAVASDRSGGVEGTPLGLSAGPFRVELRPEGP